MNDMKDKNVAEKYSEIVSRGESSFSLKEKALKFLDGFHRYGLWITIFLLIGIYIGVHVSKNYYTLKVDEVVKTGAFLFKEKVYTIQLR